MKRLSRAAGGAGRGAARIARRIAVRWRAALAVLAAIVVGPWLLFVIVANVLLSFGAIEAIVTRSTAYTTVSLELGRAWTFWPTRVHVRDARLRIDAYTYELDLQVPSAVVDMELLALFGRRVHFENIVADDVRGLYRSKLDPEEIDDPITTAYPWLDGTPPAVQPTTPRHRKPRDESWGIDLDAVDAFFLTVWVDEFDTEPCGRIRGGLHWTAGYELEVPTTTMELEAATLWIGDHEVMREMWGSGHVEVASFATWDVPPSQIPEYVSFAMQLDAEMRDPSAAALYLPNLSGKVGRGAGDVEVDVSARAGELQPGSRMVYRTRGIDLGPAKTWLRTSMEATLTITERGQPHAAIALADTRLVAGDHVYGRASSVRAGFTADHAVMSRPWKLVAASAETEAIDLYDLRPLSDLDDSDAWRFTRGSGRLRGKAEVDAEGVLTGRFGVDLRRAGIATETVTITGNASTRGTVRATRKHGLVVDRVRGALDDVAIRTPKGKSTGSWARIHEVEMHAQKTETTIEVRAELEDARPAVIHLTALDSVVKAVPELSRLERVKLRARVLVRPELVEVEVVDARQMMLDVQGIWRKRGRAWRAALTFRGIAMLGYQADSGGMKLLLPLAGEGWLRDRIHWVRSLGTQTGREQH